MSNLMKHHKILQYLNIQCCIKYCHMIPFVAQNLQKCETIPRKKKLQSLHADVTEEFAVNSINSKSR